MRSALRLSLLCISSVAFFGCGSDSSTGPKSPFNPDSSVFTDVRDAQIYRTVKIGTQRWLARNLNYKVDSSFCYNDSTSNCAKYGRLYPWQVAMAIDTSYVHKSWQGDTLRDTLHHQGVCPAGWRLPTPGDWNTLVQTAGRLETAGTYADATAAIRLKADTLWAATGTGTDEYGFDALPTGQRDETKAFQQLGAFFDIWTSVESQANKANNAYLQTENVTRQITSSKTQAFSVRCILGD